MPPITPTSSKATDAAYSLLHHLFTSKPKLQATPHTNNRTNSKNQQWRVPSQIAKWEDFDFASLMKCCDGLFGEMLQHTIEPMKFPHLEERLITFADEPALEKHFVSQWTHPIITTALLSAQQQSHDRGIREPFVEMVAGGNVKRFSGSKPDWAGTRRMAQGTANQTVNTLPGDTKVSYKWKSTEIVVKKWTEKDMIQNWLWPIRPIFTYCLNFQTRYGYIVTDEEVVAFRVRAPPDRFGRGRVRA